MALYLEQLKENEFYEWMLPIFHFFEPYIKSQELKHVGSLKKIQHEIEQKQIKEKLSQFNKVLYRNQRELLRSYGITLSKYITSFMKYNSLIHSLETGCLRLDHMLIAYINFSRMILDDQKIQSFVNNEKDNKKLILAVGTINLKDDDIEVNDEIVRIQMLSIASNDYLVVPLHGCSFEHFKLRVKNLKPDFIHVSGHGEKKNIMFLSKAVRLRTLQKYVTEEKDNYDLFFLNCCYTYRYINKHPIPFSDYTICYENGLDSDLAYLTSSYFYQDIFVGKSIETAWEATKNMINTKGYYLLKK